MRFLPPAPEYVGPPFRYSDGNNKPIHRVVIHSTVSPCVEGGAQDIGAYFRSSKAGGSAHYVVDPGEVVQSAFDSVIAWHAPPNLNSLGIEMCDIPGPVPNDRPGTAAFKAAKRAWRWGNPNQLRMLNKTARVTARLCLSYGVPILFLDADTVRAGRRGITTHANVSKAFRQSVHWDPGFWPRRMFMALVRHHARRMRARRAHAS